MKDYGRYGSKVDQAAHRIFDFGMSGDPCLKETGKLCEKCNDLLTAFYHEERLYSVHCFRCGTVHLVEAENPDDAAAKVGW